jgi:hypothetical protein
MTTRDIISKLTAELDRGVASEVQVVYLLAGIRKIIERDKIRDQYPDLNFQCDWALHSSLDRAAAKAILREFDAAHALLRGNIKLRNLPPALRSEIERISEMRSFEQELSQFLATYGLPPLTNNRPDGWAHFLHLYAKVVEDIPLVVSSPAVAKHITHVTVHFDQAREVLTVNDGESEVLYRVTWAIHDKNGQAGSIFVINSFSLDDGAASSSSAPSMSSCSGKCEVWVKETEKPDEPPHHERDNGFKCSCCGDEAVHSGWFGRPPKLTWRHLCRRCLRSSGLKW